MRMGLADRPEAASEKTTANEDTANKDYAPNICEFVIENRLDDRRSDGQDLPGR